jgi:hypothetical protein
MTHHLNQNKPGKQSRPGCLGSMGGPGALAVANVGQEYCWGKGDSGQLGNGPKDNHTTPVRVSDLRQATG